ncbi:MAG TPA: pitrilysin family protein [Pyrinomonadaceae bacterium]|nr:pitrilysin family protein [Pyrinomonadaceae bacterium]
MSEGLMKTNGAAARAGVVKFARTLKGSSYAAALLALALLVAGGADAYAQSPAPTQQQPAATAPPAAERATVPAARDIAAEQAALVKEFEVNGLKVIVKRRKGSQTVAAGLFLRGGARNVTPGNAGVDALMLDAMGEGSQKYPRAELRRQLSRTGTSISYGVNLDYSVFSLGTTRFHFDRSWDIFTDAALNPAFAPEDVARVRNRLVVSQSNDEDVPDSFLQVLQARVAYAGHPYATDPRGTAESIGRLTPEDVRAYHKQMMQTSRLLLVLVGDLDAEQLRPGIAAAFGRLPRGDYRPAPLPPLAFNASTVDITPRPLPTNYIQGVFAAPPLTAADIYPMRIASTILQTRVFLEVRSKRNLSYAPDAFLWSQGANLGGIYVTAVEANEAVRVMLDEVGKLQRQQIDQQEIASTVQLFLTRHYLGQESNAAQAGELAQYELIGGGWRNALVFIERLRAVTPADVQRVSQTYMRNFRFVVIGNPERIDKNIFAPRAVSRHAASNP